MPKQKFEIHILNRSKIRLSAGAVKKTVCKILSDLSFDRAGLSVLFVDDREIKRLNRRYLRHDRPTDVMAFSQLEGRPCKQGNAAVPFLGDVVISTETARRQAAEFGNGFFYELSLYLCHGILHLMGHDDATVSGARRMERKQRRILKSIGVSNIS